MGPDLVEAGELSTNEVTAINNILHRDIEPLNVFYHGLPLAEPVQLSKATTC